MKKHFLFLYLTFFFLPCNSIFSKDIKVLLLVIASDNRPIFKELQKIWTSYMYSDPEHIEVYFIKGDPKLPVEYSFQENVLWTKTKEGYIPGVINKTIVAMEAILPKIKDFDYIIRTNLSTFFIFPRLLTFLETCPPKGVYGGFEIKKYGIVNGSCILMSPDIVEKLVQNKHFFLDNTSAIDDRLIGFFLKDKEIPIYPINRLDILTIDTWNKVKNNLPTDIFHLRIKSVDNLRLIDDINIHSQLIKMFY